MLILIIVLVVLALIVMSLYNGLVKNRVKVDNAWSDIAVYLKKRYDLIPNLVSTVKGYAAHESQTLERVIAARNQAINNGANASVSDVAASQAAISTGLRSIFALSENYPDLKASEQFLKLQKSLIKVESELQAARRIYNNDTTKYNTKLNVFPSNIIGNIFNFKEGELFELEDRKIDGDNIKVDM